MEKKRLTRQEAIDALMAASGDGLTDDHGVSEEEILQMGAEMGVDRTRLQNVLQRGTGTIKAQDHRTPGIGFSGNEEFERIINGELTDDAVAELQGDLGDPLDAKSDRRVVGEYWEGLRYVTTEITVREGRTRIVGRTRPSPSRLFPIFMSTGFIAFFTFIITLKRAPEFTAMALGAIAFAGLLLWILLSAKLRKDGDIVSKRVDRIAERARDEIQHGPSYRPATYSTEDQVFQEIQTD